MSLDIKDFDQLVSDTLDDIVDSGVGITNTTAGSVVRTLVEAILDNVDTTNYYANYIYDAMGIDNATGDDLDRLVLILGVTRHKASPATCKVTFSTGDEPYDYDIPIPFGFEVSTRQLSDGSIYTFTVTDNNVVLSAGELSIDVNVKCDEAGHIYLPAGTINVMSSSIVGIASVINESEINSGSDEETDDEFRERTKEYIASFGKCTSDAIKTAVEDVDGVNSCTVIDLYQGAGTSAVMIVPDVIPPSDEVVTNVENTVKATKAAGIKVFIIYPTIKYIDIVCTITGTGIDIDALLEALSNYVNSLNVGQTFVVKQMERKLLNALDTTSSDNDPADIVTETPSANVECEPTEIIRVNTITVNGVVYDV